MKVHIKCFATLANGNQCDYRRTTRLDLQAGQTVKHLLQRLGLARKEVKIAFVNHRKAALETVLQDGDRVALAPAVGGM